MDRKLKIDQFVKSIDQFMSGSKRGKIFVGEIEGLFAELFDDDDQFSDLQYALAMFGAGDIEYDESMPIKEFKRAKKIISATKL